MPLQTDKLAAWTAFAAAALLLAVEVMQFAVGAWMSDPLVWLWFVLSTTKILHALCAAGLIVGGLRTLRRQSAGLRMLAAAHGANVAISYAVVQPFWPYLTHGGAQSREPLHPIAIGGLIALAIASLISVVGLVSALCHKETK